MAHHIVLMHALAPLLVLAPPAAVLPTSNLAGPMMLAACPAPYLVGGVVIAARWFAELERNAEPDRRATRDA